MCSVGPRIVVGPRPPKPEPRRIRPRYWKLPSAFQRAWSGLAFEVKQPTILEVPGRQAPCVDPSLGGKLIPRAPMHPPPLYKRLERYQLEPSDLQEGDHSQADFSSKDLGQELHVSVAAEAPAQFAKPSVKLTETERMERLEKMKLEGGDELSESESPKKKIKMMEMTNPYVEPSLQ